MKNPTKIAGAAVLSACVLAVTACSGGGAQDNNQNSNTNGGAAASGYTIQVITHETPGDTFWDKIRSGAELAAKNDGVKMQYSNDADPAKQAQLIQAAIDSKVNGIALTIQNESALEPAIKAARAAGIPVVAFNQGITTYQKTGAQMYFGSDESLAGEAAGDKIAKAGGKHPLCVIMQEGSQALEDRCAGVKKSSPGTENIQVNGKDDSAVISTLQAKLAQDKSIDWVVTLGAPFAMDALKSIDQSGSAAKLATFDLNQDAAQAIQSGKIQFAVDQQPYLQSYLAVDSLYLYLKNGNDIGGGKPVLTGPSFVDSSNIDKILPFTKNNTR